ncbi:hypothetical protein A0H81_10663 [Grifola frondosa]|uniref:Uncharacterized protein n=1 Tax=Grifola frondosa TaxID=5627 RepID=A0A1C7LXN5_GRIFR|nr:hypothetical protein A0H81_10663 [Grifola frondosa]
MDVQHSTPWHTEEVRGGVDGVRVLRGRLVLNRNLEDDAAVISLHLKHVKLTERTALKFPTFLESSEKWQ